MKTNGLPSKNESYWDGSETWPQERIQQFQLRRLRAVTRHAYQHLPFYRRRFEEAGFHPSMLRGLEDVARIPIFTKGDVLRQLSETGAFPIGMEMLREDVAKEAHAALSMTSGTLGEAFYYTSRSWVRRRGQEMMRMLWWAGWRPGMSVLVVAPGWHSLSFVQNWAFRQLGADVVIPWGTFLPTFAGRCVDALVRHKPKFVFLFLPMLYAMLAECERRGLSPRQAFCSVRSVLVVGEPMTAGARGTLREQLGVDDIFEGAGCPEGLDGPECSFHTGHHPIIKDCYVEILGLDGGPGAQRPGERGRLVLTSLADLTASLYIRVDLEDVAAFLPGPCPCGRTWPLIEVYGRLSDIVTAGGKQVLHYDVRHALDGMPALSGRPFALVGGQPSPSLRLVVESQRAEGQEALGQAVAQRLREALQVPVEVKFSAQLPVRWKGVKVLKEADLWERLP